MSFTSVKAYTQYKVKDDEVTVRVVRGRHGTLKAVVEIGQHVMRQLKWIQGSTFVDLYVGESADSGVFYLVTGSQFKLRRNRNRRIGVVYVPANSIGLTEVSKRASVHYEYGSGRLFIYTGAA